RAPVLPAHLLPIHCRRPRGALPHPAATRGRPVLGRRRRRRAARSAGGGPAVPARGRGRGGGGGGNPKGAGPGGAVEAEEAAAIRTGRRRAEPDVRTLCDGRLVAVGRVVMPA